jgi:hypothetical protein
VEGAGVRVERSRGTAAVLIRVWIEDSQPLAGTAAIDHAIRHNAVLAVHGEPRS